MDHYVRTVAVLERFTAEEHLALESGRLRRDIGMPLTVAQEAALRAEGFRRLQSAAANMRSGLAAVGVALSNLRLVIRNSARREARQWSRSVSGS